MYHHIRSAKSEEKEKNAIKSNKNKVVKSDEIKIKDLLIAELSIKNNLKEGDK